MKDESAGAYGPVTPGDPAVVAAYLREGGMLNVPWVESPFFATQMASRQLSSQERAWAQHFHDHGYLVIENAFDPALLDQIVGEYPRLFDRSLKHDVPDSVQRLLHQDSNRIQDAWWISEPVRRLAADPKMLSILRLLYGRDSIPFQTLNFIKGTEQATHSDAIHFSSIPSRFMCGVWVALEDITEDNGPLVYFPGSHKLPELRLEELGVWAPDNELGVGPHYPRYESYIDACTKASGTPPKRLTCKRGTALVWASNLLHGGSPIKKSGTTRLSQVTHYFFEKCLYYTPILSNQLLGEYCLKNLLDVRNRQPLVHSINGEPIELYELPNGRHRVTRVGGAIGPAGFGRTDAPPPPPKPDPRDEVRKTVLKLMEEQARIVQASPKVDAIHRAETLAKICDVALRSLERNGPAN